MSDYDHEFWGDLSEYDRIVEDLKDSLRNMVKEDILLEIDSLRKELAGLKEFRDERNKLIRETTSKIREAERKVEEAEKKWKNARLHELLGEFLTVGWKVGYSYSMGEKCDKCDEQRKIHFKSPQGREYKEDCVCAKQSQTYFPEEVQLSKIYVRKNNFHPSVNHDFLNRYYRVESTKEYDEYVSVNTIYDQEKPAFENINRYTVVFLKEEDCIRYCEWLNEQEKQAGK